MQKITLKKIDETNFLSAFGLKLREGQERFVSHPVRSLAQAYVYYHQCTPFGIFCDEQMVGYVMVIYDYDLAEYDIWHMMIDKDRQGLGYGRPRCSAVWNTSRRSPSGIPTGSCRPATGKTARRSRSIGNSALRRLAMRMTRRSNWPCA